MKATPIPFEEFQGKGLLDFSSSSSPSTTTTGSNSQLNHSKSNICTAVTTATTPLPPPNKGKLSVGNPSPSPPAAASSSTLSSSLNSGDIIGGGRCGGGMGAEEDWEAVLPEAAASPGQEQSILRFIMGDIEDPSVGLSKLLHSSSTSQDMEFVGGASGFGFMDPQTHTFDGSNSVVGSNGSIDPPSLLDLPPFTSTAPALRHMSSFPLFSDSTPSTVMPFPLHSGVIQPPHCESLDEKPQILSPQLIIGHNQVQFPQNPSLVVPLGFNPVQDHSVALSGPPPPKRLNSGQVGSNFVGPRGNSSNSGQSHNHHYPPQNHQFQQRPAVVMKQQKVAGEESANHQLQQAIIDHLYRATELIETGNPVHAQGILARLNHQLSPIGKPFNRAAFYCKEALQSFLHHHHHPQLAGPANPPPPPLPPPPFGVIYKIGAYKSFCEISPVVQFANFTCNQSFLEALEGFSRVHILSFDVGFGGEWASLMQELVLRNGGPPSLLRITSFASPGTQDELELCLTQETLKHFARELNIALEFEVFGIESLNSIDLSSDFGEAIAVNLPIGYFLSYPSYLPAALRFIKQLSPKIVVSIDRGCDGLDLPFPNHMIHALQCYSSLLESLDAVNVNLDVLQKIERYLIQPGIDKIVIGRQRSPEKMIAWRSLFLSCGFSPLTFSNFNESQAECLVQRNPARGFNVEKRQSALVLCWHRKELVSVSAWRC